MFRSYRPSSVHGETSAGSMTLSGNEITDAVRTAGEEGDGLTPPAGVGIWPAATNLVTNGGFETDTTGWEFGLQSGAPSTERAKFGSHSGKVTCSGSGTLLARSGPITLTAAAHIGSVWVYIPSGWDGGQITFSDGGTYSGATVSSTAVNMALTDQWQRVTYTITPVSGDLTGYPVSLSSAMAASAGKVIYVDGAQCETGPIATPYIETDGGTASRVAGRVQGTVADLGITAGQFWIATRFKTGWASAQLAPNNAGLFEWYDSSTEVIDLRMTPASPTAVIMRSRNTNSDEASQTVALSSGSTATAVGFVTAALVGMSVNGANFTTTARANGTPAIAATEADFGAIGRAFGFAFQLQGDELWVAIGSGTLTDADAAALNAFGDTPPSAADLAAVLTNTANPTSIWSAVDDSFVLITPLLAQSTRSYRQAG